MAMLDHGTGRSVLLLGSGGGAEAFVAQLPVADARGISASATCAYAVDGPFAGISRLLLQLAQLAEERGCSDLISAHDAALCALSPALGRIYPPRFPMLTLSVKNEEGVRMLSPEWLTRYANGVVDFLFDLQDRLGGPIQIGLRDVEQAGPALEEVLLQLARRGRQRHLHLWMSIRNEQEPGIWSRVTRYLPGEVVHGGPAAGCSPAVEPAGPDEGACAWEIRQLLDQGDRKAAFMLMDRAIALFLRAGFARDALRYAQWWREELRGEPSAAMLNRLASALTLLGDSAAAEAAIGEALALELPPRTRAGMLYARAMIYTRFSAQPDLERAMELIAASIEALGDQPAPDALAFYQNGLALVLLRRGRAPEALAICQEALAHLEAHSAVEQYVLQKMVLTHNIGRVHREMGDAATALEYLGRVLDHDPFYMELHQERGELLMRLGRYAEALADFEQGQKLGPPSPRLCASAGNAATALGDAERAEAFFTRALELDEEFTYAYKARGLSRYDQVRLAEALLDYDTYLERRPADLEARCNRGSLRHDLGDLEGALADLDEALRLDPHSLAALTNRVAVLADMGRYEEALACMNQAYALDPANEAVQQNRTYLLAMIGG